MHRQQRTNLVRSVIMKAGGDSFRVKVQGPRIDVREDRARTGPHESAGRSEEAERGRYACVARADSTSRNSQPQGVCPGGTSRRSHGAAEGSHFALQGLDFDAKNEMLRGAD